MDMAFAFKHITAYRKLAALVLLLPWLAASCTINDDETQCPGGYYLHFKYDYNMKFADALAQEVTTLTVYVFGKEGKYLTSFQADSSLLRQSGYRMQLPLEAGNYHIVAWAGVDKEWFNLPDLQPGQSTLDNLVTELRRGENGEVPASGAVAPLWHGELENISVPEDIYVTHTDTVSLVKDTHTIRVMLQQVSGKVLHSSDFETSIVSPEGNGRLNYDNTLLPDSPLTYRPYYTSENLVGGDEAGNGQVSLVIAELSTLRIMENSNLRLRIRKTADQSVVIDIPLTDYLLLTHMEGEQRIRSNQEYLDRQDRYTITFFLTSGGSWLDTRIEINGWALRCGETDL